MKKLISALALCIGTAAFAQSDAKPQKPSTAEQRDKGPGTGVDATEVGPAIGDTAKKVVGTDEQSKKDEQAVFSKKAESFSIRGIARDTDNDDITLERTGLPKAELSVKDQTKVTLDGKQVKADAIPEGAPVRAKFQLNGDDAVAVELIATSPKGAAKKSMEPATGGSGTEQGVKDDAQRISDDAKQTGQEMKHDTNKAADDAQQKLNE